MILQSPSFLRHRVESHPPVIQVTALYEDLEAGIRAKALMDCVQSDLVLPAHLRIDLWRFDWLNELSIRNLALNIASNSTLVLISASTNNPFAVEMERWLQVWMQSGEDNLSALVLLAAEESQAGGHPLQERLRSVAEHKGAELYCEFFKPASAEHGRPSASQPGYEIFRPQGSGRGLLPSLSDDRLSSPHLEIDNAFR